MFRIQDFSAEKILKDLKDFQRRSAENAFERLYLDKSSTARFLIADEVGLGKTLTCRGLIALAIEHLCQKKDFKNGRTINIIYICSNQDIAEQNVSKLNFVDENKSFATRLTLIPEIYAQKDSSQVRFISFTPSTSLNVKGGTGVIKERALLYYFLRDIWDMKLARAKSLYFFRSGAGGLGWEQNVQGYCDTWDKMDLSEFGRPFQEKIKQKSSLKAQFLELREFYPQYNSEPSSEIKLKTYQVIGELRSILAQVCLKKINPDILIMDEFQRFKNLFDESTETGELAKDLFSYPEVKTLLLSATPYKMYTLDHEEGESHYEDFLSTTEWLLNQGQDLQQNVLNNLKLHLDQFRASIFKKGKMDIQQAQMSKKNIEAILRRIMSRVERVKLTQDHNSMLFNKELEIIPSSEEMVGFVHLDEMAKVLSLKAHVDYWKSSPYLLNLMEDYDIKRRLLNELKLNKVPVKNALAKYTSSFLDSKKIFNLETISPNNSRLEKLQNQIFENESWKLLWVPPTAPYYKLRGAFQNFSDGKFTKSLVFSSWKVVPRAVATLLSHEAESKAYSNGPYKGKRVSRYRKNKLLNFSISGGELKSLKTLILFYPSLSMIEYGDIFTLGLKNQVDADDVLQAVQEKIRKPLASLVRRYQTKKEKDKNWYWAAPLLLDKESRFQKTVASWFEHKLQSKDLHFQSEGDDEKVFLEHIRVYKQVFHNKMRLGSPPDDLLQIMALVALASPANVIYRSFLGIHKDRNHLNEMNQVGLMVHASKCALSMRSLFNSSEAISILRQVNPDFYWASVLHYCFDGNFQSVCDEYIHILKEDRVKFSKDGLYISEQTDENVIDKGRDPFQPIADAFQNVCSLRTASLKIDIFQKDDNKPIKVSTPCKFALEYGNWKNHNFQEDHEFTRAETVRDAFNSPFRPFVLATTSVGQEGLDFHRYCHSIFHWNLPRNPVDLEQREGRIHRFKGHVIRKNVASKFNILDFKDTEAWAALFEAASSHMSSLNKTSVRDMIPYWIFDGPFKIERNVPIIPYSKDHQHFQALLKTLARYRLAFGQPRQDELLKVLEDHQEQDLDPQILKDLMIDLSP